MTVLSWHLKRLGYDVTLFNAHLPQMQTWFPHFNFEKQASLETLQKFDLVFCQYADVDFVQELIEARSKLKISFIYASYNPKKHAPLERADFVCYPRLPLVESLKLMGEERLGLKNADTDAGLAIPSKLVFKKHAKRILIHPTSTCTSRTWSRSKYLKFAQILKKKGYEIAFIMSQEERKSWEGIEKKGFLLPAFNNLSELAEYIYESAALIGNDSGPAHLASLLKLSTLIITNDPKRLMLWQPGWKKAALIFPPAYMPNLKFLRLRIDHWQKFTSVSRVLKKFSKLELSIF